MDLMDLMDLMDDGFDGSDQARGTVGGGVRLDHGAAAQAARRRIFREQSQVDTSTTSTRSNIKRININRVFCFFFKSETTINKT